MAKKDSDAPVFTESGNPAVPEPPAPESSPPADPRIGLVRFLQVCPQKPGITALLRSKHIGDVKTRQDWEGVIQHLLHKKVQ
jgi:hypothetical protein